MNTDAIQARIRWLRKARAAQIPPEHESWWTYIAYTPGRGYGKDLDVATPLPTPSGWTTMGGVAIGDWLLDERGRPCRVTAKFYPETTQAYRIAFSDGTSLVAGADHQWVTLTHQERKQFLRDAKQTLFPESWAADIGRVRTTRDVLNSFTYGKRGDLNHCIPVALPLLLPERALPIPPWTLGYWLANGHADGPYVTAGSYEGDHDDGHVTWRLLCDGFDYEYKTDRDRGCSIIRVKGFATPKEKSIPSAYLRASAGQRLALLQGLLDGDGYVGPSNGVIEFCTIKRALADQVLELVRSLGERPALYEGDATLGGRVVGRKFRVCWRASLFNPFALARKLRNVKKTGAQSIRLRHRMLVSIEHLREAPQTACVTVDSPNSMYLAGEGMIPTHNTRLSAEDCAWYAATHEREIIHVVCPTSDDLRKVYFEGPSGLLNCMPPSVIAKYNKTPYPELVTTTGTKILGFGAEKPDRLRGPQCHRAYADELAAWQYPETWDQLLFGLRLGRHPRAIITTTPRPTPLVLSILKDKDTLKVAGSTFDNAANLSAKTLEKFKGKYEGTRLGRQELNGEVLDDVPGALWTRDMIDAARAPVVMPDFVRVVVAIDPSGVRNESDTGSDEVGIVVAAKGVDGRGYVLFDGSCRLSPLGWGRRAIDLYRRFKADRIIGERNFGGAMVEAVILSVDANVPYKEVTASRGKAQRAEPVAALYEQGRVSHIDPDLDVLEDQQCCMTSTGYLGEGSPDRVDAAVWALTELFLGEDYSGFLGHYRVQAATKKKEAEVVKAVAAAGWLPPPK